jgi:hypothetical protein
VRLCSEVRVSAASCRKAWFYRGAEDGDICRPALNAIHHQLLQTGTASAALIVRLASGSASSIKARTFLVFAFMVCDLIAEAFERES